MPRLSAGIGMLFLLCLCTPPPQLLPGDVSDAVGVMADGNTHAAVDACGDVRLAVEGDVHRGSVEMHCNGAGKFSVDFYARLGIPVGSIRLDSGRGTVVFDGETYTLAVTQTLDALPFAWGKDMTLDDFRHFLLGFLPDVCAAQLRREPDSSVEGRKTISVWWKTDSFDVEVKLRKRERTAENAAVMYKKAPPYRMVTLKKINGGRAYKIELRENDRNYFSINYSRIKRR